MNIKTKRRLFITYMLVVFIGMLIWNIKTPLMNDDLYYVGHSFLTNIKDGIHDYFYWNGRFWGQTFFRLSLMKGQGLASFINSVLFTLFLLELLYITNSFRKNKIFFTRVIGVSLFALSFIPGFVSVFIWRAGAGNYMDLIIMDLAFLILLLKGERIINNKILYCVLLFITGIIAGWGNENTSGGLVLISVLILIKEYFDKKKVNWEKLMGTVSVMLGYTALILSPGDKMRLKISHPDFLKEPIFLRIHNGSKAFIDFISQNHFMLIMIALCLILCCLAYVYWRTSIDYWLGIIFIIGGFASILVMVLSPEGINESRTYAGGYVFLIIGVWYLIPLKWSVIKTNKLFSMILIICAAVCLVRVSLNIHRGLQFSARLSDRYSYIASQKRKGKHSVEVRPLSFSPYNNYSLENSYIELNKEPNVFPNIGYEWYLKINKVTLH